MHSRLQTLVKGCPSGPGSHPAEKSLRKRDQESQSEPGLGSLPPRHNPAEAVGLFCVCGGAGSGMGEIKDTRAAAPRGTHPRPPPLGKTFKGRSCPLHSPRAMKFLESGHRETLTLFFVSFRFFQIPEAADSSLGTQAQNPRLTTHSPARTFGQHQ